MLFDRYSTAEVLLLESLGVELRVVRKAGGGRIVFEAGSISTCKYLVHKVQELRAHQIRLEDQFERQFYPQFPAHRRIETVYGQRLHLMRCWALEPKELPTKQGDNDAGL